MSQNFLITHKNPRLNGGLLEVKNVSSYDNHN